MRLSPWPKAVRVSLNGVSLGEYGSDVRTVTLRPGDNTLLFENPACYSEKVAISAAEDPGEVRVRLRWKPALLVVQVEGPEAADVVVDGHILGHSGQLLAIPVQTEDGKMTAQVHISAAGYEPHSRSVELRANQLTSVQEKLAP